MTAPPAVSTITNRLTPATRRYGFISTVLG